MNMDNKRRRRSNSDISDYTIQNHDPFFYTLNKKQQIEILNKENELLKHNDNEMPLRYKILLSELPISTKSLIIQKLDQFNKMNEETSEYNKLLKWINGLSMIPFNKYIIMPVSLNNSEFEIQEYLYNSYKILNNTIYGQNNAKNKIMQILAQWITNPKSIGQVIALEGSAGVGKTSLIKNGVSKALDRPFCFYGLGGATDIASLEGHSYTYEGATWGRLIEMLMESKVMNPVIFFDELDKISDSTKGNEISNLLIHLTDYTQNNLYQDKYFSGINIDFSKTVFFFSYNNIDLINPILKDRLTIIKFDKYTIEDKIKIIKDYTLNEIFNNIGFKKNEIIINDNEIKYIINNYCKNEEGIRDIKRQFEELLLKINLLKLLNITTNTYSNSNIDKINITYKINNLKFPLTINKCIIDNILSK